MSEVTVVVPVRDDHRLAECAASVDTGRVRLLVILERPTPRIRALVAGLAVDSLECPAAGGPAACEYGLRHAPTRHVLFMDSDCVFQPGALDRFVDAVGTAPFVKGRIVFRYGDRWQQAVATSRTVVTNGSKMLSKVPLMVDRAVLADLDGFLFDARLSWTEDFHLSVRVRRRGLPVRRIPDAVVVHRPMGPVLDLSRGFCYGAGHAEGARLGLEGYWSRPRVEAWRTYREVHASLGREVAAYAVLWRTAFWAGYWKERMCGRR